MYQSKTVGLDLIAKYSLHHLTCLKIDIVESDTNCSQGFIRPILHVVTCKICYHSVDRHLSPSWGLRSFNNTCNALQFF